MKGKQVDTNETMKLNRINHLKVILREELQMYVSVKGMSSESICVCGHRDRDASRDFNHLKNYSFFKKKSYFL